MSNKLELVIRSSDPAEFAELLQGVSSLITKGNAPSPSPNIEASPNFSEREFKTPKAALVVSDSQPDIVDKPAALEPASVETAASTPPLQESPSVPEQYTAPSASIEAVRKALVSLIEAGKQAQVQELFRRFGGEKLSDIPEDKLGELLAAAEELTA